MDLVDILKNKKGKLIIPFILYSFFGIVLEIFYTAATGGSIKLQGHTSLWMIPIYGTGGTILAILNEYERYYNAPMILQTLIGGFIFNLIEFIGGVILNLIFHLSAWDYSNMPFNLLGQINLITSILWNIAIPGFIWAKDIINWACYRGKWFYNILDNYKDLITLK